MLSFYRLLGSFVVLFGMIIPIYATADNQLSNESDKPQTVTFQDQQPGSPPYHADTKVDFSPGGGSCDSAQKTRKKFKDGFLDNTICTINPGGVGVIKYGEAITYIIIFDKHYNVKKGNYIHHKGATGKVVLNDPNHGDIKFIQ